jgi:predicted nucleotidyltransferase component of viral defense system
MIDVKKAENIKNQLKKLVVQKGSLPINELKIILTIERIIGRLEASSKIKNHLIFKGGFVLLKILKSDRFTRDLDALCKGVSVEEAKPLILEALQINLNDGFWFGDIKITDLEDQGDYGALRFDCAFQIGEPPNNKNKIKKLSRIHFDVGFGDKIPSKLATISSPPLLPDGVPLSWRVYPLEFIYSEKLQTFVKRGSQNSRGKDLFDMVLLFESCKMKENFLEAIKTTFKTRQTNLPLSFLRFSKEINLRQLKSSWGSVHLPDNSFTFEENWYEFQDQLKELDKMIEG